MNHGTNKLFYWGCLEDHATILDFNVRYLIPKTGQVHYFLNLTLSTVVHRILSSWCHYLFWYWRGRIRRRILRLQIQLCKHWKALHFLTPHDVPILLFDCYFSILWSARLQNHASRWVTTLLKTSCTFREVPTHQATWSHDPEDHNINTHWHTHLRSSIPGVLRLFCWCSTTWNLTFSMYYQYFFYFNKKAGSWKTGQQWG
jgi:hypothetical protein